MKNSMDDKASETIKKRQDKEKQLLIEQLKKTPIIQIACEKVNISRATYYRWRNEDEDFANQVEEALAEGNLFINDVAESQLLSAIKDQNLSAITFWLKHHHPTYTTKVEVTGQLKHEYQLNEEEEALISKAIAMVTQNGGTKK